MKKRLLVLAGVVAAIAVLAVWSVGAASEARGNGYAVVGLADAEQLVPAGSSAAAPYDELKDPEFGCGKRGHLEYDTYDD